MAQGIDRECLLVGIAIGKVPFEETHPRPDDINAFRQLTELRKERVMAAQRTLHDECNIEKGAGQVIYC